MSFTAAENRLQETGTVTEGRWVRGWRECEMTRICRLPAQRQFVVWGLVDTRTPVVKASPSRRDSSLLNEPTDGRYVLRLRWCLCRSSARWRSAATRWCHGNDGSDVNITSGENEPTETVWIFLPALFHLLSWSKWKIQMSLVCWFGSTEHRVHLC